MARVLVDGERFAGGIAVPLLFDVVEVLVLDVVVLDVAEVPLSGRVEVARNPATAELYGAS